MPEQLLVVIVTWNCAKFIGPCLDSLKASLAGYGGTCTVVVVDNASADGTADLVRRCAPWVVVIEAGQNLGFAAANNLAISQYPEAKYVFLLNPDTVVSLNAVTLLIEGLEEHDGAAIAGPTLWNEDGSLQWVCCRRLPRLRHYIAVLFGAGRSDALMRWLIAIPRDTSGLTQAVSGAAMMCDGPWLRSVGMLESSMFFGHEDTLLCWQAQRQDRSVVYVVTAEVTHMWGGARSNAANEFDAFRWASAGMYFRLTGQAWAEWLLRLIIAVKALAILPVASTLSAFGCSRWRIRRVVLWRLLQYALRGEVTPA